MSTNPRNELWRHGADVNLVAGRASVSDEASKTDEALLEEIHFLSLHRESVRHTVAGFLYAALQKAGITVPFHGLKSELTLLATAIEGSLEVRKQAVKLYRSHSAATFEQQPPQDQVRRDDPGNSHPQSQTKH
jgi:hypothetical protein